MLHFLSDIHSVPSTLQITGVILLAVGVWGKLMLGPYISLIADNSTNAPYVLIGTGTVIIVFGLFGCFATCRGSPWMLKLVRGFRMGSIMDDGRLDGWGVDG